jgi:uncharacterized protein YjgD (DUF1641 family)
MADPIEYTPTPARTEPTAREELDTLLQTLHEQGVLRLVNDIAGANKGILEVLVRGLNAPGTRNVIQNLAAAAMVLGKVPPGAFYKFAEAVRQGAATLDESQRAHADAEAPGIRGVYRLLRDDEAWRTLGPMVQAVGAFGRAMAQPAPEKPISAYTGKESQA